VHQGRGQLSIKRFIPLRAESVAGFVGAPSAPSVVSVPSCGVLRRLAASCGVLRRLATCALLRDGADGERSETTIYTTVMFHSNQPETNPLSAGVSRPYLPPAPNKATETVIFLFSAMFAPAAAAAGGSSSRRQQQQQEEEAAGGNSSSSRRKQQQEEVAIAGDGNSSSSSRNQQQEAAAAAGGSRRQQGGSSTSSSSSTGRRQRQQQQQDLLSSETFSF